MAGAIIEIKYFNNFLLKKINNSNEQVVWNGSFGIPEVIGGYPVQQNMNEPTSWAVEESRIRGGYNNTSVDYGAKAYIVEDEPMGTRRFNTLIYSGIFNSRTGVNNTNVFSVGEDITRSLDPANGSIQKLYSEDTNLNIFQELKVSRALIDKDAIYSAEGGGTVTSSNLVIGAIQPYLGKYGISKNPESFAIYGSKKYFTDKNNNVVLRLSGNGIEEISSYGMKDFFRDELALTSSIATGGKALGAYDIYGSDYVLSLQSTLTTSSVERGPSNKTLNFDERSQGWVSFFDYVPDEMFSLRNNFYSVKTNDSGVAQLWRHYDKSVRRGNYYGKDNPTSITFVFNPNPTNSKTFKTIGYEGSNGWQLDTYTSDETQAILSSGGNWSLSNDVTSAIVSYNDGEYVLTSGQARNNTAVTASTTITLDVGSVVGYIFPGDSVTSEQILPLRNVVSYNTSTGVLVLDGAVSLTQFSTLFFNGFVSNVNYTNVFGTTTPPLDRYYAGFDRKENKYVANLINNTPANPGEIIFNQDISGIKGFYATVKMSTDLTTQLGGEKTLFSVESAYDMNNGY
jgi:hypothetical protein|tara:strand:+ start:14 stop:1717 length:1704 start_codon:yes stop_codon:yes gene_type:complete